MSLRARLVARLGGLINRIRRPVTLGVRAIVRDGEGRVLLVRHTYVPGWYLPGGAVDRGESAVEALTHELLEEANVRMVGTPRLLAICFNPRAGSDHVALFEVGEFEQTGPKTADHEIAEVRFFPLDALPEGTTLATRARLDELLSGASISLTW
jgi:ADP-ribose pyrophosphatase YjhB (NUDIX family)